MLCIFATDAGFLHDGLAIDLKNRVFGHRGVCFAQTISSKFSYKKNGMQSRFIADFASRFGVFWFGLRCGQPFYRR